jgi:hypothetical protein
VNRRLNWWTMACLIAALGIAWLSGGVAAARAQQEMLPEESAAKGKQVLQQVIKALGGQAYLSVRDSDCVGKMARFGLVGDAPNFTEFRDLWVFPNKNRTEYSIKTDQTIIPFLLGSDAPWFAPGGTTVTVFSGSEGWTLDGKKRIDTQPEEAVKSFNDNLETSMNHVLRTRLNEPGLGVRYAGTDIIDLKEAEWIEFTDRDRRVMRLGIDQSNHLPLRWVIATRDPETRRTSETMSTYIQYMNMDGVKTPLSIELYRDEIRKTQTYLSSCKYNTNLSPDLFTRAALEQRAAESGKKGHKDSKK